MPGRSRRPSTVNTVCTSVGYSTRSVKTGKKKTNQKKKLMFTDSNSQRMSGKLQIHIYVFSKQEKKHSPGLEHGSIKN